MLSWMGGCQLLVGFDVFACLLFFVWLVVLNFSYVVVLFYFVIMFLSLIFERGCKE